MPNKNNLSNFFLCSYCMKCEKTLKDPQIARYPNGVIVCIKCMKDPKVCPLTGQLFTVDSWEAGSKRESPLFLRPCDTPKIRKTICQTDEKTHHYLSKKTVESKQNRFSFKPQIFCCTLKRATIYLSFCCLEIAQGVWQTRWSCRREMVLGPMFLLCLALTDTTPQKEWKVSPTNPPSTSTP